MRRDHVALLADIDRDLSEWRDSAFNTSRSNPEGAVDFWRPKLVDAWTVPILPRLEGNATVETLLHIGALQIAKWSIEGDRDRVEGEADARRA